MNTSDNGSSQTPQGPPPQQGAANSAGPAQAGSGASGSPPSGAASAGEAFYRPGMVFSAGAPAAPAPPPEVQPFTLEEYAGVLLRPQRVFEYVLGGKDRLARSIWDGEGIWPLAAILLAVSFLAAIPYGVVSPRAEWWKIAALFTGSLVICFPSLHAFAQFFGLKLDLGRNFALSLIITATAGLFTFGFFPIIWFIGYSIRPGEGTLVGPSDLSRVLLWLSLALGLVQIARCLGDRNTRQEQKASLGLLFLLWTPLLIYITHRMWLLLELV